ncbi:extracellular solute-binding protein [Streptomyces sp. 3MP-14]|uniref:Extracellular solute-binding protein n=1 Tax=Streptomyces mimosae TaxID=2586635 RepID=A0A5N6AEB9_9ACTN|nr:MULTISPECIES: extracellular solute-binding protein [Streptomyces]KAB8166316.1 extracellular solute-binding protein [Streptomyces mimosae]KAB8174109.1 extracellular solute-binding protein [Streptomyces sp. 3MP-14]
MTTPRTRPRAALLGLGLLLAVATGCAGPSGDGDALKVAYPFWGEDDILHRQMQRTAQEYEEAHPGREVELIPVPDQRGNFATKIELMQRSAASAPDVVFQDTVMTNADAQAGYLRPIDEELADWPDWAQFDDTARQATRAADGHTYGVLTGTDVRAVFYDKRLFAEAGLPTDWQPRDWDDIIEAGRAIEHATADADGTADEVIPINVYATKSLGETTAMQGLLMLLYGTDDGFYDPDDDLFAGDTPGLRDSLGFVDTVFAEGLGPGEGDAYNPNFGNLLSSELLPQGRVGIAIGEGSWTPKNWLPGGGSPWPEWTEHLGVAAMPTQHGQAPGRVSLSGGWMLSVSAHSQQPDAAFDFVTRAADRDNALEFAVENAQLAVRHDVAADPAYLDALPTNRFFTDLLEDTAFRPTVVDYLQASGWAQIAMEAVLTGTDPADAAEEYAAGLRADLGEDRVRRS